MRVKVNLAGVIPKIKTIASNRKVGLFLASTCERYMNPYVPMDTGMLAQNTVVEPFRVYYNQNYAADVYEGNGRNFHKDKHPLATAKWDEAMISAKRNQIAKEMTEYIKRGGF